MVDNVVLINNNFSILEFLREYSLLNGMRWIKKHSRTYYWRKCQWWKGL